MSATLLSAIARPADGNSVTLRTLPQRCRKSVVIGRWGCQTDGMAIALGSGYHDDHQPEPRPGQSIFSVFSRRSATPDPSGEMTARHDSLGAGTPAHTGLAGISWPSDHGPASPATHIPAARQPSHPLPEEGVSWPGLSADHPPPSQIADHHVSAAPVLPTGSNFREHTPVEHVPPRSLSAPQAAPTPAVQAGAAAHAGPTAGAGSAAPARPPVAAAPGPSQAPPPRPAVPMGHADPAMPPRATAPAPRR